MQLEPVLTHGTGVGTGTPPLGCRVVQFVGSSSAAEKASKDAVGAGGGIRMGDIIKEVGGR